MASAAISIEGLSKSFGPTRALQTLNLEVAPGEVLGYLGPNGAGKTTTIRLLLGLIRPTAGRALIFGRDCQKEAVAVHQRLAYVPGEANLWPQLTGAETLHLLGRRPGPTSSSWMSPRRAWIPSWNRRFGPRCGRPSTGARPSSSRPTS